MNESEEISLALISIDYSKMFERIEKIALIWFVTGKISNGKRLNESLHSFKKRKKQKTSGSPMKLYHPTFNHNHFVANWFEYPCVIFLYWEFRWKWSDFQVIYQSDRAIYTRIGTHKNGFCVGVDFRTWQLLQKINFSSLFARWKNEQVSISKLRLRYAVLLKIKMVHLLQTA